MISDKLWEIAKNSVMNYHVIDIWMFSYKNGFGTTIPTELCNSLLMTNSNSLAYSKINCELSRSRGEAGLVVLGKPDHRIGQLEQEGQPTTIKPVERDRWPVGQVGHES